VTQTKAVIKEEIKAIIRAMMSTDKVEAVESAGIAIVITTARIMSVVGARTTQNMKLNKIHVIMARSGIKRAIKKTLNSDKNTQRLAVRLTKKHNKQVAQLLATMYTRVIGRLIHWSLKEDQSDEFTLERTMLLFNTFD